MGPGFGVLSSPGAAVLVSVGVGVLLSVGSGALVSVGPVVGALVAVGAPGLSGSGLGRCLLRVAGHCIAVRPVRNDGGSTWQK